VFDNLGDVLIHEMYQLIDELGGEINDESYEVMSQKMKYQKKENVPTTSKRKKGQIIAAANENYKPDN